MATSRFRLRSSPTPVHEDYATYFVPPDIAMESDNHRSSIENGDSPDSPHLETVQVVPQSTSRKDTFDPFTYKPFGLAPEDNPKEHPWPVPILDLIEPTPPSSVNGDTVSASSIHEEPIATGSRESSVTPLRKSPRPEDVSSHVRVSEDFTKKARNSEEKPKSETVATPKEKPNKKRRQFSSREKQADAEELSRNLNVKCLDVMQSKWLQDPDDNSREIVTLTSEVTGLESENMDASFRWMQVGRNPLPSRRLIDIRTVTSSVRQLRSLLSLSK
jgi:hypothetical protein